MEHFLGDGSVGQGDLNAMHRGAPLGGVESAYMQLGNTPDRAHARPSRFSLTSSVNLVERQQNSQSSGSQHDISMEDDSREHAPTEHQLATTKVRGTSNAITQSEFVSIICRPGAGAYALSELFDFRRPKTGQRSKTSKILQLDEKQLDAMYALSGCSDVLSVMSSVNKPARDAMWNVYGIDKHGFSTWFKNRRLVPKERMTSPGSAKKQRNHLSLPASDLKQH